jgi:hypothetical protein
MRLIGNIICSLGLVFFATIVLTFAVHLGTATTSQPIFNYIVSIVFLATAVWLYKLAYLQLRPKPTADIPSDS